MKKALLLLLGCISLAQAQVTLVLSSQLSFSGASLPDVIQGTPYSQSVAAYAGGGVPPLTFSRTGGTGTNTWTVGASGTIAGTPGAAETDTVIVKVLDNLGSSASATFSIVVRSSGGAVAPIFSPIAGTYATAQNVTMTSTTGGATSLLTMPGVTGIAGHLWVHGGYPPGNPPNNTFGLISEQANPLTGNGSLQTNTWGASALTGFTPNNASTAQLSYAATGTSPTTTAQYEGAEMGAYLQSVDLGLAGCTQPPSLAHCKMMITPQENFSPGEPIFANSSDTLTQSMMLQIPTATSTGNQDVYLNVNSGVSGPNSVNIQLNASIFHLGEASFGPSITQDAPTGDYIFNCSLGNAACVSYVQTVSGTWHSAVFGPPLQPFAWSISYAQFQTILTAVQAFQQGATGGCPCTPAITSVNPSDYTLTSMHVNAEFHYDPATVTLGWSMSNWSVAYSGNTIYYTTDGSTPTYPPTGTTQTYAGPVAVATTETLKAITTAPGYTNSSVTSGLYTIGAGPAAAPVLSPTTNVFSSEPTVTMTDSTPGASIYYCMAVPPAGCTPTGGSTLYTTGVLVTSSTTISAIAIASGYTNSAVTTDTYTLTAAAPTFGTAGGNYNNAQTTTLSDTTPGTSIYYCTAVTGSCTPTTASTLYTGAISITQSETIYAMAVATGFAQSSVSSQSYTLTVATPSISPASGGYSSAQSVSMTDATTSAVMYFTTDGSTPNTGSTLYSAPFNTVSSGNETVNAIGVLGGYTTSAVASNTYSIGVSQAPTSVQVFQGGASCSNNYESPGCVTNTQKVTWSAVSGALSYTILRNSVVIASGIACCSYIDNTATNSNQAVAGSTPPFTVETAYTYQVEAVNGSGTSPGTYAAAYLFSGTTNNSCENYSGPGFSGVTRNSTSGSNVITVTAGGSGTATVQPYGGLNGAGIPSPATGQPYLYPYGSNGTTGTGGLGTYYMSLPANATETGAGLSSTVEACQVTQQVEPGHTYSLGVNNLNNSSNYLQQWAAQPLAPPYDVNVGGMNYFSMDFYLTSSATQITTDMLSRPGANNANTNDLYSSRLITLIGAGLSSAYGTPVVGSWFTLKVPFAPLGIGTGVWNGYVVSNWHGTATITGGNTMTAVSTIDGSTANIAVGDKIGYASPSNSIACAQIVSGTGPWTVTGCSNVGTPANVTGAVAYDAQAHVISIVSGAGPDNGGFITGQSEPDGTFFGGYGINSNATGVGQWALINFNGATILSAGSSGSPVNFGHNRTSIYKPQIFPNQTQFFMDNYGWVH